MWVSLPISVLLTLGAIPSLFAQAVISSIAIPGLAERALQIFRKVLAPIITIEYLSTLAISRNESPIILTTASSALVPA